MGRRAQIIRLRWPTWTSRSVRSSGRVKWEARKYGASRRVVPLVPQLHNLLKRAHVEQGRPTQGLVCPPHSGWATTGMLNTGWLTKRVTPIWESRGLAPISLQEARHSAATWLDAAGVPL
jgi:integrase